MRETWKPVVGYKGWYAVSSHGRVRRTKAGDRNTRAGRILRTSLNGRGYHTLMLCRNGKPRRFYVHRLTAAAFLGQCPRKKEVNHKDGDKGHNHAGNLEYVTRREQVRHARDVLGVQFGARGSASGRSKLTEKQVKEIRRLCAEGMNYENAARRFNVTPPNIRSIVLRETWTHI